MPREEAVVVHAEGAADERHRLARPFAGARHTYATSTPVNEQTPAPMVSARSMNEPVNTDGPIALDGDAAELIGHMVPQTVLGVCMQRRLHVAALPNCS